MIERSWTGTAESENADAYVAHISNDVLPVLRRIAGFRGLRILRRRLDGSLFEFRVVTRWDSLESVRAFAGDALETAVVPPAARTVLATFDDHVVHHDVVVDESN